MESFLGFRNEDETGFAEVFSTYGFYWHTMG
jgi:hypothetical protein